MLSALAKKFELTIDVVFDSAQMFERVRKTGVLRAELFSQL